MMSALKYKIIFILLFLAWTPLLMVLWPYPTHEAAVDLRASFQPLIERAKQGVISAEAGKTIESKDITKTIESFPNAEQFHRQLVLSWFLNLILFIAGSSTAIYAFKQFKGWKFLLIAASASYLLLAYPIQWRHILEPAYWQFWWDLTMERHSFEALGAMYREVIFPFIHVFLIVILALSIFIRRTKLVSHSTDMR
jgi:hypothetical protein